MSVPMKKRKQPMRASVIPANGKGTGVRYSDEKRSLILSWYKARLKVRPRGAISDTCKHFEISATALMNWIKPIAHNRKPLANNGPAIRAIHKALIVSRKQTQVYEKLLKSLN